MIEGKDKSWHNKMTIKMWENIARANLEQKNIEKLCIKYNPMSHCFLCEWYLTNHTNCIDSGCPFAKKFPEFDEFESHCCCHCDSPYYKLTWSSTKESRQIYANEMVDWLKQNLEVKND